MSFPTVPLDLTQLRAAMSALLTEFTSRLDCGEPIGDLLQEEALLRTPRGETRGRGAIAGLFAAAFDSRRRSGHVSRHSCLDVRVRAIGNDRFEVRSLLLAFALGGGQNAAGSLMIGDQIDIVALEADGEYRFTERSLAPALEFSLSPKGRAGH
jgi:hypothetical protein